MKELLVFIAIVGISLVSAEIVPRFPPTQPIPFSTANSTDNITPAPPSSNTDTEDKTTIDPFTFDTAPPVIVILESAAPPEVIGETSDQDASIIGGERDIRLTVEEGGPGLVFTAGATSGVFSIATPNGGSGFVLLQYDGIDGSSQLSLNNLDIDLTTGGAIGFRIEAQTDVDTEFVITLYDTAGNSAESVSEVPGGLQLQSYFIPFDESAQIDFTSIAGVEFLVEAFENVDFTLSTFVTFGPPVTATCQTGSVLPCDFDYYALAELTDVEVGDYIVIEFFQTSENSNSGAHMYVRESVYTDLQSELESNENIIDTLGNLPGPTNYTYYCEGDCKIEIVWSALSEITYYLGIEGYGFGYSNYTICTFRRNVEVVEVFDELPNITLFDQRPTAPPDDRVLGYAYYFINVTEDFFIEGSYLTVNLSRVVPEPGTFLRVMYESLPETAVDTGVIGEEDSNSEGERVDDMIFPFCVDTLISEGDPIFTHPIRSQDRIACECFSDVVFFNDESPDFQLTCSLTVDPCHFRYGAWYISVELYERRDPEDPADLTGFISYTLTADIVTRDIQEILPGIIYPGELFTDQSEHYRIFVPRDEVLPGLTHMVVHINNLRNGEIDLWVHQGTHHFDSLAGGPEGCAHAPANATCHTSDACYVVIERCHFDIGYWYISVSTGFDEDFLVFDEDRGAITYTLEVEWLEDAPPVQIYSGVPVFGNIHEHLYEFYVLHVPQTVDTWLHAELYVRAEDTEVFLAALHGELPGSDCYARPDFYCLTGDRRGLRWSSGPYSFNDQEPIQRESCSFTIDPCHLQAGPLFFSVYGDFHFYDQPVSYTLWVDFDVPLALVNGRSLTEVVGERQYQHYYIRADEVPEGSWLSVEITNVKHGIGQSIEGFVNFNQLAGGCPCFESLYTCTDDNSCSNLPVNHNQVPQNLIDLESVFDCCTLIVPASHFKSGVWYIGVYGVSEDYTEYTTPIGYTLTATVHNPPVFNPLFLGTPWKGALPQWNTTHSYAEFTLSGAPITDNQLVFKMTWIQNCEFKGKHDDTFDVARMFVNLNTPAGRNPGSHLYSCETSTLQDSYCTITINECEWQEGTYFIAVQGDYDGDFEGRFTLNAYLQSTRDYKLSDGIAVQDSVGESLYNHYFIETPAEEDQYLWIEVYPNYDHQEITVYLNKDARAGDAPCYSHTAVCTTKIVCTWQLLACDLRPGRYYISVQGSHKHFYNVPTEYTITATHKAVEMPLLSEVPVTGHLYEVSNLHHYTYHVGQLWEGGFLTFTVDGVKHGSVRSYIQYGSLAGDCPCFSYYDYCDTSDYCTLTIPSCELQVGNYYFSVLATGYSFPSSLVFPTPLGYTAEVQYIRPVIKTVEADVGRQIEDLLVDEFVGDNRYRHYQFYFDDDDYQSGNHVIVEISEVREGNLRVFYNFGEPGAVECHLAEICNGGVPSGSECLWQIPYCIIDPDSLKDHWITIYGDANREAVQFNILIWRQEVPSVFENPSFTLDNAFNSGAFPGGVELNVTHPKQNEPNGWTQFIRLPSVNPGEFDPNNGQMLELFFYRITAPFNEQMSFNVYVHPSKPAGAHGCCSRDDPVEYGACQEAPCLNTADTTTQAALGSELFTHTCVLGNGFGENGIGNPFFGSTCTVRVWPCEFNKYCDDVRDWYVSVVPIVPIDNESDGSGLSYSFQWRTRDIRLSASGDVGSTNITDAINTFEYTIPFSVPFVTSESQGWRSFFINVGLLELGNARLSIQTKFTSGIGVVYIRGDDFASASPSCHDYQCFSNDFILDCTTEGRFIESECCGNTNSHYFITVRNTDASPLEVAFRIIITPPSDQVEIIPDHPPQLTPYFNNGTDFNTYIPGIPIGVPPESYDHYQLLIDDADLDYRQSWIIDIERNDTSPYQLIAFLRYGLPGGNFEDGQLEGYYPLPEGCYSWQYSCILPKPDSRCIWLLPHCDLLRGFWFLSIWNPSFVLDHVPINLPDYTLSTFIEDPPSSLDLNTTIQVNSTPIIGILTHYYVNVTAEDLAYDLTQGGDVASTYWNRYLRVVIDGIIGDLDVYLNYDDLAGATGCLNHFETIHCVTDSDSCYIDVLPCTYNEFGEHLLKTGVYFIGIQVNSNTTYNVTAYIVEDVYTLIPPTGTTVGTGHRNGTNDQHWSYTFADSEIIVGGNGGILSRYYKYFIDLTGEESDDLDDNTYVIVNITSDVSNLATDSLQLRMWRDDCTEFLCDLQGPESWCAIDAITLAPCSLKGGRYFFIVDNPNAMNFTLNVYLNETTIQPIEDRQIITEIVYPYEYQQYFYEASDVGEGATLTVRVCSICGDVQVWIRPDLPAGPTPDITGAFDSCSINSCETSSQGTFWNELHDECCEIFLDTCNYEQRGYYIGIRGVEIEFPNAINPHIYLPAKYTIQPIQTNINFTRVPLNCPNFVEHYTDWNELPVQYFVDIESLSYGTYFRVALLGKGYIEFNINHPVGYSHSDCKFSFGFYSCASEFDSCSFEVPYCDLVNTLNPGGGRVYLFVDAPRGTEFRIERFEPSIPFIHTNLQYQGSLSSRVLLDNDVPYVRNVQYYRFDITPPHTSTEFFNWDRFYGKVIISDIQHGTLEADVTPIADPFGCCGCTINSCSDNGEHCVIEIEYGLIKREHNTPTGFIVAVYGEQHDELQSVHYSIIVKTNYDVRYLPIGKEICDSVEDESYDFFVLQPHQNEQPHHHALHIIVSDYQTATLYLKDNELATDLNNDYTSKNPFYYYFPLENDNNVDDDKTVIDTYYYCGYDNLHLSIYSEFATDYRLQVLKETVKVKELFDDTTSYADDDDDDACPHEHDFWVFNTSPSGEPHPAGSFLRIAVDSEFQTQVYINKNSIAFDNCYDSGYGLNDPLVSGTTTNNVYDFCDFDDGPYYVTVVSDGPYYIYSDVRDDVTALTLGEVYHDVLQPGMYKMYTLELCEGWFSQDDRLVVEITDVEHGGVYGWIQLNSNAGFSNLDQFGSIECSISNAYAEYGSGQSGYDFLLVNSCHISEGIYYILIRASPPEGTPSRNCNNVKFRLFPYLTDLQIDPEQIDIGRNIRDQVVNLYTIDRIEPGVPARINYYSFDPFGDFDGYRQSYATIRVANVQGGLLRILASKDNLAIPTYAQTYGSITALTKTGLINPTSHIQSGTRPFSYQQVMEQFFIPFDDDIFPPFNFCDGCADYCVSMENFNDPEHRQDTSAALFLPDCYINGARRIYIAVEAITQFSEDHDITFDLRVEQEQSFTLLQPDVAHSGGFSDDNWDYDLYYSISAEPEAMRWRVVVNEASEGVLLTVRNHNCPNQATWSREMWCDADYFDRSFTCEIEISTKAEHPGALGYYLWVSGKNATYEIDFWRGRENCHEFAHAGRDDGLDFCAGLIPYATWRWDQYHTLDREANCFFEQLYDHFKTQPCWSGVSHECNNTLQAFACYESFHACDRNGFATGTCVDACEAVEYECLNSFDNVDLEFYQCSSNRYLDANSETCTGNPASDFISWDGNEFLYADPNLLLFKSAPTSYQFSYGSSSTLTVSFILMVVLLVIQLV